LETTKSQAELFK